MKLETIFEEWEKDSKIDRHELAEEALRSPELHHKYFKILSIERLQLRKFELELKKLRQDKYDFYTLGRTEETDNLGWELPARGTVLKNEAWNYVDKDKDVIKLTLEIGLQQEKIQLLESIIKTIHGRGFQIRAAIDYIRYIAGN